MRIKGITVIWVIFTMIFASLAIFHFIQSGTNLPQFQSKWGYEVELNNDDEVIKTPFIIFIQSYSEYVKKFNKQNRNQNIIAGFGYIIAALVSIFSMILSIKQQY